MSDLIDRQAAIDAVNTIFAVTPTQKDVVMDCIEAIVAVPSAQPDPCEDAVSRSEIIRLILERGLYCDTQADKEISADIIRQLPSVQQETRRWIPCSDRLPEDGTWNIFTDGKRISIERYKFDIVSHFWPEPRWFDLSDAVAWMPLPEPWKGEEDGAAKPV